MQEAEGLKDHWHVRIGEWCVVYFIDDASNVVRVTRFAR
jgi:hypothetical protein